MYCCKVGHVHCFVQLMKDNGALKKLIAVAFDVPPIMEEKKLKGGKEKEKAPLSTKGKKNVDGMAVQIFL